MDQLTTFFLELAAAAPEFLAILNIQMFDQG